MATESDVDIRSAHPYWAYPFNDISVVHNGQLTNYWGSRREMERRGHRFMCEDVASIAEQQKAIGYESVFIEGAKESTHYMNHRNPLPVSRKNTSSSPVFR